MKTKSLLIVLVFLTSIIVVGCLQEEKPFIIEKVEEEVADTGVLVVTSSPSTAQVYVDGELEGDTPFTLYNTPVGSYNIVVKKEGYLDFEKTVNIKVGRTEEIEATLTPATPVKTEEIKEKEKIVPKNISTLMLELNKINLSSFAMYFDFEKELFTEIRTDTSDLLSRKYDTYVYFTALTPAKIYVLNEPIEKVKKGDCIFGDTAVAPLFSKQTLCIMTVEGSIVALGGNWQTTPNELEWVLFN